MLALDGTTPAINALTFNGTNGTIAQGTGGTLTLRNNGSAVAPTINVAGGTPTISAPVSFANTVTMTATGVNDQLTISGPIGGAGALIKTGPGTLSLSGTNTYAGKTTVNGGTLSATSEASLGTVPGTPQADQIPINNNARLAFTGNANLTANQGITVGAGNGTLDVATGQTAIIGGAISGSGTLTKTGDGTMDYRNVTTGIAGPVTLTAGTFAVHN
ncbi:MAG: autotransporter-associated beta strand repeat-containing protein, partial [Devosia sp.]